MAGRIKNKTYRDVVIERPAEGRPHEGKVLAVVQAHADDAEYGLVAKLIDEGYTGYLIRTSNDEAAGRADTRAQVILENERDNDNVAKVLGLKGVFNLNYRNHRMDGISAVEVRARLIFLFRALRVDTVTTWDPWAEYEENPDHFITARAVASACWMAGTKWDFPEHFEAGLEPHRVRERYYFARPESPQIVNRVVETTPWVEKKIDAMVASSQQLGGRGAALREELAQRGLRLPSLGDDDRTANRAHVKLEWISLDEEIGKRFGLQYAEQFHYVGPNSQQSHMENYVEEHAEPL